MYTYIHICMSVYIHIHMHVNTYINTYMHIHTLMYWYVRVFNYKEDTECDVQSPLNVKLEKVKSGVIRQRLTGLLTVAVNTCFRKCENGTAAFSWMGLKICFTTWGKDGMAVSLCSVTFHHQCPKMWHSFLNFPSHWIDWGNRNDLESCLWWQLKVRGGRCLKRSSGFLPPMPPTRYLPSSLYMLTLLLNLDHSLWHSLRARCRHSLCQYWGSYCAISVWRPVNAPWMNSTCSRFDCCAFWELVTVIVEIHLDR